MNGKKPKLQKSNGIQAPGIYLGPNAILVILNPYDPLLLQYFKTLHLFEADQGNMDLIKINSLGQGKISK